MLRRQRFVCRFPPLFFANSLRSASFLTDGWRNAEYISCYDVPCPYEALVLYNKSSYANKAAIEDLRSAWPDVFILQTVAEGQNPVVDANHQLYIPQNSWGNMHEFTRRYRNYMVKNRLAHIKRVGFLPLWGSVDDNPTLVRYLSTLNLQWIGASDDAAAFGKTEYKEFCVANEIPTANFFTLETDEFDTEKAIATMANMFSRKVKKSSLDPAAPFFLKSKYGASIIVSSQDKLPEALGIIAAKTTKTDGIFVERMIQTTKSSTLYHLEMDVDAGSIVDGGRLLYNANPGQRFVDIGLSSVEMCKFIPSRIYEQCVRTSKKIADHIKHDGSGTHKMILVKSKDKWKFYCSDFVKRAGIEHKALTSLRLVKGGRVFNPLCEQVMRSCGYCPPNYMKDLLPNPGSNACAQIRLMAPELANGKLVFSSGVSIDGVMLPKNFNASVHAGKIDADMQFGSALISAPTWEKLLVRLQRFARDTVVLGRNVKRDYFKLLQKFFDEPRMANLSLGCDQTLEAIKRPPCADGKAARVAAYLYGSVPHVIVNGYRANEGVKNRSFPTDDQLQRAAAFRDSLLVTDAVTHTPFLDYLSHRSEDQYYKQLREVIEGQRGAMVSVFPRDVQQECCGSESHLISFNCRLLMERYGARAGFIGYEMGGAQYQTAELNKIDSSELQKNGILCNLATFSLTRSQWMNTMEKLPKEAVKYIITQMCNNVRRRFHLETAQELIPYFPYNFHAGNVEEQDEVTKLMLAAGLTAIPNFVWSPRFTMEHFQFWLLRQFQCWDECGRTLHHIRLKNPGQQIEWTSETIAQYVSVTRRMYKEKYGKSTEPIIHIHNHNFNGLASHVAFQALKACQAEGYNLLVVDTAPPLMTHNNNLVVSKALNLTSEQREALYLYNEGAHVNWQLTERFRDYALIRADPWTIWSGGSGNRDISTAERMGIERQEVEEAKMLGAQVTELGGIVTPYSEWCMIFGYACYQHGLKTYNEVKRHIEAGETLNLPRSIVHGLADWKTLLPRPPLVNKLLENYKENDPAFLAAGRRESTIDFAEVGNKIIETVPECVVTKNTIARVVSFKNAALATLRAQCCGQDNTWLLRYPEIGYAAPRGVKAGTTFTIGHVPVTFGGIEDVPDSADVIVTFKFEGQWIRVRTRDERKSAKINKIMQTSIPTADPENPNHIGASVCGFVEDVYVKIGQVVREGDPLYSVSTLGMIAPFTAQKIHNGKIVSRIYAFRGEEVTFSTPSETPLLMTLKDVTPQ